MHWVGGNPLQNEVYGWAAWRRVSSPDHPSPFEDTQEHPPSHPPGHPPDESHTCTSPCRYHAVATFRNPGGVSQAISLAAESVFEVPDWCGVRFVELVSAYREQRVRKLVLEMGKEVVLDMEPFEVLVFDTDGFV